MISIKYLNAVRTSPDLIGNSLVKPFTSYCNYFHEGISNNNDMKKIAWVIYTLATSILGLALGSLAIIGMISKLIHAPFVEDHNKIMIDVDRCDDMCSFSAAHPEITQNITVGEIPEIDKYTVFRSFSIASNADNATFVAFKQQIKAAAKELTENLRFSFLSSRFANNTLHLSLVTYK
jgi:hypothetical protein